ncbi:hypothetical protein G3I39_30490, partial [Streptomyces fulvissimus]|nr:hypothetical protein [Streptomyces microflavus]
MKNWTRKALVLTVSTAAAAGTLTAAVTPAAHSRPVGPVAAPLAWHPCEPP